MAELSPEQQQALEQQKANCPFCKIVKGEIPSKKVFENDNLLGVLDINPAVKGHTLLMPKEHYPIMPLIPKETFVDMVKNIRDLSKCIKSGLLAQGTTVFVANGYAAGQQSTHFMLHLIPREEGDGLDNFDIKEGSVPEEDVAKMRDALKQNIHIMMRNHFQRMGKPIPKTMMPQQKVSKDQLLEVLNANPQVKDLLLKDTEKFRSMIPTNPQLQALFADVDIDALVKELGGEAKAEEPKVEEKKKEEPAKEDKPSRSKEAILKEVFEKNPELLEKLKDDIAKVIEIIKSSKYSEELGDFTEDDLKKFIPEEKVIEKKEEPKGEEDKKDEADLDTIESLFK